MGLRTQSESYSPRSFPGHPGDCLEIEEAGLCWGNVRDSSKGMRCQGHRNAIYRSEPVPPTPKEIRAREVARKETELKNMKLMGEIAYKWGYSLTELQEELAGSGYSPTKWDLGQSRRWFRPFMRGGPDVPLGDFYTKMSNPVLLFLHSGVGSVLWHEEITGRVRAVLNRVGFFLTRQIQLRSLRFPNDAYNLKLAPKWEEGTISSRNPAYTDPFPEADLKIDFSSIADEELQVVWGIAYEVADYSCLERGVRQVVMHLFSTFREEMDRRGFEKDMHEEMTFKRPMILPSHPDSPGGTLQVLSGETDQKAIGYWWSKGEPWKDLPSPEDYIDLEWDQGERAIVIQHLEQGEALHQWMGSSPCRLCDDNGRNGSSCLSDGVYVWPEGFAHYVKIHGVRPDQEFIDHVIQAGSSPQAPSIPEAMQTYHT